MKLISAEKNTKKENADEYPPLQRKFSEQLR
jgi:hypothetical protein